MSENPNCKLCDLHQSAGKRSVCLKGGGGDNAKLMIFLDHPNMVEDKRSRGVCSEAVEWLKWAFARMSISRSDVYVDYVLKCYPGKLVKQFKKKLNRQIYYEACSEYRVATLQRIKPKAIVVMGSKACEAFLGGDKIGEWEGTTWIPDEPFVREHVEKIWVSYSPAAVFKSPGDSVTIFRVLWFAAIDAGLKPKIDKTKTPFDYGF